MSETLCSQEKGTDENKRTLIFTYGTLKQGLANHSLMQDLIRTGDAAFGGLHRTILDLPLVCGPHGVPFLLNLPGSGHRVLGELYAVSDHGLARIDELEGTTLGHYERLPIQLHTVNISHSDDGGGVVVTAEAYYAHRSYAEELWKRKGRVGFREYTEKEAKEYVKRDARPKNRSFLDEIRLFVSSSSSG